MATKLDALKYQEQLKKQMLYELLHGSAFIAAALYHLKLDIVVEAKDFDSASEQLVKIIDSLPTGATVYDYDIQRNAFDLAADYAINPNLEDIKGLPFKKK